MTTTITPNITFLLALNKNDNSVFSSIGLYDSEDNVDLFIPKHFFTEAEKNDLLNNKTSFNSSFWGDNSDNVYIQETPAYTTVCDLTNFSISIENKNVSFQDLITDSNLIVEKPYIYALTVFNHVTYEIVFLEGTDEDGYNYHSIDLPDYIDINDDLVKNTAFETNARKLTGVFGDYTVSIVRILI